MERSTSQIKHNRFVSRGVIAIALLALIYGTTGVTARFLGNGNGLFEQWYIRFGLGFIFALILFYKRIDLSKFLHLPKKEWGILIIRTLAGWVLATVLYTLAVEKAKIGPVAFMQVLPTTAVLGVILFHEKITIQKTLVVVVAFIGAAIVVVSGLHDLTTFNQGVVLSFISGALFSLALVTRKWHSDALNNYELTIGILGLAFLMNYLVSISLYHRLFVDQAYFTGTHTLVILIAGFLSVCVSFLGSYGFQHTSAVVASSILDLELVFAPIAGYIFYSETMSTRDNVGGIIIFVAAITMNELNKREEYLNRPTAPN